MVDYTNLGIHVLMLWGSEAYEYFQGNDDLWMPVEARRSGNWP